MWRQTWSLLYNSGISLSTEGRVLDSTDTQVYVFVFCFCTGKNTGRTVITIKEVLCPQTHGVFQRHSDIPEQSSNCAKEVYDYLVVLYSEEKCHVCRRKCCSHTSVLNNMIKNASIYDTI